MSKIIFDIEADGLIDSVTKIHCLSYYNFDTKKIHSLTNYKDIISFFSQQDLIICGHNIIRYDIPVLEKLLNIKIKCKRIDTLGISWYLFDQQKTHGLEHYGEVFKVPKPFISDWKNLSLKEYINRCETDVRINLTLYNYETEYLNLIYNNNQNAINRIIGYLNFKLDCLRSQEETGCYIDRGLVETSLKELEEMKSEKVEDLKTILPPVIKYKEVTKPDKLYKKDGSLTVRGQSWLNLLEEKGLDSNTESITVIDKEIESNPNSTDQIKNLLFSLGWKPDVYKESIRKNGEITKVPQIYNDNKEVCNSIKALYSIQPKLENLDSLSLINHRIGVFKSFLDCMDSNNKVIATASGFTNTLRLKHLKPIANLVKPSKFFGDKIRGCIIAPNENYLLCGSDMTALEDTTKQHYMYFFDPEYVKEMRVPGFDPHLDVAVLSGLMSKEDCERFKKLKKEGVKTEEEHKEFEKLSDIRSKAKIVNFAGIYGVGATKLSQTLGSSLEFAQNLHKAYWERNKAVKLVSESIKTKTIKFNGEEHTWCFNPVSKFWYSIRVLKDVFSTINQGTGVYCFDTQLKNVRKRYDKIILQYHDEMALILPKTDKDLVESIINKAIEETNEEIKLNVPLGCSMDFGIRYSDIH